MLKLQTNFTHMIQTKHLKFSYPSGMQFSFPDLVCTAQNTLLITGGSGKGKTTLLHLLGGLLVPTEGSILIDQKEISKMETNKLDFFRGKNIGFVLQQNHFVASVSVLENVMLASWLSQGKLNKEKAKLLLEQLGLADQINKLPSELSVGQQQRVSIARAVINEPKLLLADEPTSSLDDENALIVSNLLQEVAKQYHAALVIVTHDQRLKNIFENQTSL
jgi:putative ABC transport system ATP-binding protein